MWYSVGMSQKVIVTHDGKFHADDCFAVAALLLLEKDAKVVRTRDEKLFASADFVVDVGGVADGARNRFDHHQRGGAGERSNGIPYAAFGLVWKKFGAELSGSEEAAASLDARLVAPIDAHDNGVDIVSPRFDAVHPYEISDAIKSFTPSWEEEQNLDARFADAASFAKRILEREIARSQARLKGIRAVIAAYEAAADKRLIILPEDYSWKETLATFPEPLFVVHPQDGKWRLACVRDNPSVFKNRKDLPESWAGLREEELAKVTGVADAIFCHRNRFTAAARSRGGVLALANLALAD